MKIRVQKRGDPVALKKVNQNRTPLQERERSEQTSAPRGDSVFHYLDRLWHGAINHIRTELERSVKRFSRRISRDTVRPAEVSP